MKDQINSLTLLLGNLKMEKEELNRLLNSEIESTSQVIEKSIEKLSQKFDGSEIKSFIKQPYVMLPAGKDQWYVAVPKIFKWQIGWLEQSTDSYNIFRVNKFMKWLGDIPKEMEHKFKFKEEMPITVDGKILHTGEALQEKLFERYREFLHQRKGKDSLTIKPGKEFGLIAKIIDDGTLPFNPIPVENEDLIDNDIIKLRDYQQEAWKTFLKTGAVGIFWAYSAGKTYFGMKAISCLKGRKLVVVPSITLKEQWESRLREYGISEYFNVDYADIDIITYQSFEKIRNEEYVLAIYDECHHLPANTFSRLSTIRAKYRIGLSATPYREDGRTDYIFALTGFPVGLSWDDLIELGVIEKPDVVVYRFGSWQEKERKLKELLVVDKKTLIFCDSIVTGKRLSKELEIPFVYGETKNRTEIIKENQTVIVSRVGDEGLSIPNLERTIEIDFLFGSRRQEGQRLGRLFHGENGGGEHFILMTNSEFEDYQKRLYAISEKGFKIQIIQ